MYLFVGFMYSSWDFYKVSQETEHAQVDNKTPGKFYC